jgi:membrane-bound lytic murein transglycosylase MltF
MLAYKKHIVFGGLLIAVLALGLRLASTQEEKGQVTSDQDLTGQIGSNHNEASETPESDLPGLEFGQLATFHTGDLDVMEEERVIRVLTVYGLGRYYFDGAEPKGMVFELFNQFETFLNKRLKRGELKVHVVIIPVTRDELLPGLLEGRGDIAAAGLTITGQRETLVDFSIPISNEISEVLVTGPSAPEVKTIDDLAGREIYVRASSSYRTSLDKINTRLKGEGKKPIKLIDGDELLEDDDLLEMVNSGLLPWAVVDDYKAVIWADVFDDLTVRNDIVFRKGGRIGYGIRKNSPLLKAALNDFLKTRKQGTLQGNMMINRNIRDFDWAQNVLNGSDFRRFEDLQHIFEKYGEQYGFDYLMVAAQGFQESRLDQSAKSHRGAVGIMQLLPSTAAGKNVNIPDISTADSNIHAGVKYLDFIRNRYFSDPEIDHFNKTMFAFAAYNAGPARVRELRDKTAQIGYDPNIWFDNVEYLAAREIGRETVQYVSNILKYYIAYTLALKQQVERIEARERSGIE